MFSGEDKNIGLDCFGTIGGAQSSSRGVERERNDEAIQKGKFVRKATRALRRAGGRIKFFMNNIEQIKDRLNILDVVGAYLKLEKAGSNFRARCPFHNEKTPSFFVSPERGTYKCFGCGAGGDIFSFVEQFEGVDFKGALKILAEKAGIELKREDPKKIENRNRIYEILEEATLFFENNFKNKQSASSAEKMAWEYLLRRGLTEQTIKQFRVGFAEDGWRHLFDFLTGKGYDAFEIKKAGLIKQGEKGGYYDRFRSRIIFPLFDNSNRPIAFSGRFFDKDNKPCENAKYLNSPETELFSKSNILYGYNFAKTSIRKRDFSILVEGQMDLLMCHQVGYNNTVASSGTALTENQLRLLNRLSNKIILAFDGDNAGFASATKAASIALRLGMDARLLALETEMDPAELILTDLPSWKKALKEAKHIIDFYVAKLTSEIADKRKLNIEIQNKVLPFVALINSEMEKANFVEGLATHLEIPSGTIWEELEKLKATASNAVDYTRGINPENQMPASDNSPATRRQQILRQLAGIYLWQLEAKKIIVDLKKLENKILKIIDASVFDKIKNDIIFEAEIFFEEDQDINAKINELLLNLKIETLNEKIELAFTEQKRAEKEGDAKTAEEKFKIYNELSKEKNKLIN